MFNGKFGPIISMFELNTNLGKVLSVICITVESPS